MSKFTFELSFKDVKIIKQLLERRIRIDSADYKKLKNLVKYDLVTDEGYEFIKEHEEHIKCLEHFVNEMKSAECKHGSNIFGEEYL